MNGSPPSSRMALDARRGQRIVGDARTAADRSAPATAPRRGRRRPPRSSAWPAAPSRPCRAGWRAARAAGARPAPARGVARQRRAQVGRGRAQVAVAGEQQQCPPVRDRAQRRRALGGGGDEAVVVGLGQIGRHVQQGLPRVAKRRREDRLGGGVRDAQPLGGRSRTPPFTVSVADVNTIGPGVRRERATQARADVDGRRVQADPARAGGDPADVRRARACRRRPRSAPRDPGAGPRPRRPSAVSSGAARVAARMVGPSGSNQVAISSSAVSSSW